MVWHGPGRPPDLRVILPERRCAPRPCRELGGCNQAGRTVTIQMTSVGSVRSEGTGSLTSFRVDVLTKDDWRRLQSIRLAALNADPTAFLSSHETELAYLEPRWREEFSRGEWYVMCAGGRDVGLVAATREPNLPLHECDLEFLWVAPGSRRAGCATMLLRTVLDRLRDSG